MGAVRRQSARISDNVKIKKTPLKVQDKKGSTSRRGRSALADQGHDGHTRVTSHNWAVHLGGVNVLHIADEGVGPDDI